MQKTTESYHKLKMNKQMAAVSSTYLKKRMLLPFTNLFLHLNALQVITMPTENSTTHTYCCTKSIIHMQRFFIFVLFKRPLCATFQLSRNSK